MAYNFSRYSKIYKNICRPDVAQTFPRHVFLREPNKQGRFENTFNHLTTKQ